MSEYVSIFQALREQFPEEEGYTVARHVNFNFKDNQQQQYIKVCLPQSETRQYSIGMEPAEAMVSFMMKLSSLLTLNQN